MGRRDGTTAARTLSWEQELELLIGPLDAPEGQDNKVFSAERSAFASEEERKAAWLDHRETIVEECLKGRPWAEERYD